MGRSLHAIGKADGNGTDVVECAVHFYHGGAGVGHENTGVASDDFYFSLQKFQSAGAASFELAVGLDDFTVWGLWWRDHDDFIAQKSSRADLKNRSLLQVDFLVDGEGDAGFKILGEDGIFGDLSDFCPAEADRAALDHARGFFENDLDFIGAAKEIAQVAELHDEVSHHE